jgi:hypothetical protein
MFVSSRIARRRGPLLVGLLALVALAAPAGVLAKCVPTPVGAVPWTEADAVFVGTVTSVANGERWATVAVEEVWHGPDQPTEVIVRGGPEDSMTSVDRTYAVGIRYIFAVTVEDGALLDNSCSGTTPADEVDLGAVRPAEIRTPGTETAASGQPGPTLAGLGGPLAVVAVGGALLLITVLLARRRET